MLKQRRVMLDVRVPASLHEGRGRDLVVVGGPTLKTSFLLAFPPERY